MSTLIFALSLISLGTGVVPHAALGTHGARSVDTRRVWSNDDVPYLRANAPVSVFVPASAPADPGSAPNGIVAQGATAQAPYVKEDDPQWYEREIAARRAELAFVNGQLANIAAVETDWHGYAPAFSLIVEEPGILLPGTVYVLENRRAELQSEIAALRDLGEARGIPRKSLY